MVSQTSGALPAKQSSAKFTTSDCLNTPQPQVELPGLEAIAQQKFDLSYYELAPSLQSYVREEAVKRAGNDLLAALKTIVDAWLSPLEKRALKVEMCESARDAIALAEGRADIQKRYDIEVSV